MLNGCPSGCDLRRGDYHCDLPYNAYCRHRVVAWGGSVCNYWFNFYAQTKLDFSGEEKGGGDEKKEG